MSSSRLLRHRQMRQHLGDVDVHRAGVNAAPAAGAGRRAVLLGVIVELAKEAIAQPLAFGGSRVVPARDAPVSHARTAIPATNALVAVPSIVRRDDLIPYGETAAGRTH